MTGDRGEKPGERDEGSRTVDIFDHHRGSDLKSKKRRGKKEKTEEVLSLLLLMISFYINLFSNI